MRLKIPHLALAVGLIGAATVAWHSASYGDESPSADEAAKQARIEYIQRALKGEASPVPGKRVVSAGTGFYVTAQRVLTNRHVVDGCAGLTLRGIDGKTVVVTLAAADKTQDLALVNTSHAPSTSIATFRPSAYRAGDIIGTIGYPDQGLPRIEPFLTRGLVLGPDRRDGKPARFAVRADIRPGNSGGPVFDPQGVVIGIMNAKIDTVSIYKKTGRTVDNIGFAIATGPIFDFLARHGVKPTVTDSRITTPESDLLDKVKPFTVRLSCWR
jgi:S1-C subfamily serine protease